VLPAHLKRYVVEQDYSRYTPVDQEVWRYIMRQLKDFLSTHAHPCYVEGLEKTGIEIDRIPHIQLMSEKLEKFGWRAVPVSGFIPPAAFMELQSLGYLPIASDMRTVDHLSYTPAPDIVHEAAGHAPILVDQEFAAYLKDYAQVARKAILSHEDMGQYEAIRLLSDLKEDAHSTAEQIRSAEQQLEKVTHLISHISEAAYLGRMNWWTAEYGLIGTPENPKIFGAGLLSSVGEARSCLSPQVKKIPLTLDCINYAYDITEPQPQLFVTPDFNRLREVLEELAATMAYRVGGAVGLERAKKSQTINTVQINSGLQISGKLKDFSLADSEPAYIQFEGPSQLCIANKELPGHGTKYHAQGFGSPIGLIEGAAKCLSEMTDTELQKCGIEQGRRVELKFKTGARVKGDVISTSRAPSGKLILISFSDCNVTREGQTLFQPEWGTFDMAIGHRIESVFGGSADRTAFGEATDFATNVVPRKKWPDEIVRKHSLYNELREIRAGIEIGRIGNDGSTSLLLEKILAQTEKEFPNEWLLLLALLELGRKVPGTLWCERVTQQLKGLASKDSLLKTQIEEGLRLLR
jgi:phenylalanine-4-hydroxylase